MMRTAGFTLVETLVSLALLGLLGVLLATGLTSGQQVWAKLDARAAGVEQIAATQNLLRARLERGFPETRYDASRPYVDFFGEVDRMQFLSSNEEARQPDAIQRFTIGVTTKGQLVLTSASGLVARPQDVAQPDADLWMDRILMTNVRAADFSYFGAALPDNQRRWRATWRSNPVLP
jgi:general secretion pathway protein J